jgi:hypothetical protein
VKFRIEYAYPEKGANPLPRIQQYLNDRHAEMRMANPRGFLDQFEQQLETILECAGAIVHCKVDFVTDTDGVLLARFYPKYLNSFPETN